jgi:hypothetical protein
MSICSRALLRRTRCESRKSVESRHVFACIMSVRSGGRSWVVVQVRTGMTVSLRIALVAPNRFPIRQPFAGGLGAHVWHLARSLAQQGHQVSLFAAEGSRPALHCEQLTIHPLRRSDVARQPCPPPGAVFESDHHAYLQLMLEFAADRRTRFDVIHNHSLHQMPIRMAARLSTPLSDHLPRSHRRTGAREK